jgi:hypothetical protein
MRTGRCAAGPVDHAFGDVRHGIAHDRPIADGQCI